MLWLSAAAKMRDFRYNQTVVVNKAACAARRFIDCEIFSSEAFHAQELKGIL